MPETWHLLGAGSMGSMAAARFSEAGFTVQVVGKTPVNLTRQLHWPNGHTTRLRLEADADASISRLIIATKAPDTVTALRPLLPRLAPDITLLRLQNGLGSLDDIALPSAAHLIEAISNSGAWREHDNVHIVADNETLVGDGTNNPPAWFTTLQTAWPTLQWTADITCRQLLKLSVNAVINPLTALHDCDNGNLVDHPDLRAAAQQLADETDRILRQHAPDWPNDTLVRSLAVARQTARNVSSMRADLRAGRTTEIEFINGWLLRCAARHGVPAPHHAAICEAVRARHP